MIRKLVPVMLSVLVILALASPVMAHPLGNFTTNVHLGLDMGADRLDLLLVVDMAEIPTFREMSVVDTSEDGEVSPGEMDSYAATRCVSGGRDVDVRADTHLSLRPKTASLSFPPGEAGLETMRLECTYEATLEEGYETISIDNRVHDNRIGWSEIVVTASGLTIDTDLPEISPSQTLTSYPEGDPLQVRQGEITVTGKGEATSETTPTDQARPTDEGLVARLSGLAAATGPIALIAAVGLGVLHAMAPGHGKTLMAAYLVGREGKPRQALVLGLSVAFAHTIGVAVLGLATLFAAETFHPESLYPWLSGASAGIVTIIGLTMLFRAFTRGPRHHRDHGHDHRHGHDHEHDPEYGPGHDHDPGNQHDIGHRQRLGTKQEGWRSMATLGLAGGMVPSASALILLLAGIGSGRPGFGLLLVACFGLGMSLALVGTGLAVVGMYRLSGRMMVSRAVRQRWQHLVPRLAGLAVTGVGLALIWDVLVL